MTLLGANVLILVHKWREEKVTTRRLHYFKKNPPPMVAGFRDFMFSKSETAGGGAGEI